MRPALLGALVLRRVAGRRETATADWLRDGASLLYLNGFDQTSCAPFVRTGGHSVRQRSTSKRSIRMKTSVDANSPQPFLVRHEFLLRRLHSLSGLIPVGAFMCVHLLANASVLESPAAFQKNVYKIHSLGALLPLVEWVFIFIPILFHAIFGFVIIRSGLTNHGSYPTARNYRYTLQRATGMIAFLFIVWHVFHMHGWFHFDWWRTTIAEPLGGARFSPFRATTSAAAALNSSFIVPILYAVGVLSCVFHLANGIWTMGITWGVWVTEEAQRWASAVTLVFGLGLAVVGLGAVGGFRSADVDEAAVEEDKMFQFKIASGELQDDAKTRHKRGEFHDPHDSEGDQSEDPTNEIETSVDRQAESETDTPAWEANVPIREVSLKN